jgi:AcrR family transcriptional regulator
MSRRDEVLDAAIAVTAACGIRGLTHRGVDVQGSLPFGTTSNYFRSRASLTVATFERLAEIMTSIIADVSRAPVHSVEDLIQTLGGNLAATLGPGRVFAAAAAALFTEAGIDESLHPTVVLTNQMWWTAMGSLLRAAGIVDDVERKAQWLLSYGNGLVVDQLAMRDPAFDPIGAMRAGILGFV